MDLCDKETWAILANAATAVGVGFLVWQICLARESLDATKNQLEISRDTARLEVLVNLRRSSELIEEQFSNLLSVSLMSIPPSSCSAMRPTIEEAIAEKRTSFFNLLRHYEMSFEAYRVTILDEEDWQYQCESLGKKANTCAMTVFWEKHAESLVSPRFKRAYESCRETHQ